jgi:hypothetical protein
MPVHASARRHVPMLCMNKRCSATAWQLRRKDGAQFASYNSADFPDAQRANMWVQHLSNRDDTADEALSEFTVGLTRCDQLQGISPRVRRKGCHA